MSEFGGQTVVTFDVDRKLLTVNATSQVCAPPPREGVPRGV